MALPPPNKRRRSGEVGNPSLNTSFFPDASTIYQPTFPSDNNNNFLYNRQQLSRDCTLILANKAVNDLTALIKYLESSDPNTLRGSHLNTAHYLVNSFVCNLLQQTPQSPITIPASISTFGGPIVSAPFAKNAPYPQSFGIVSNGISVAASKSGPGSPVSQLPGSFSAAASNVLMPGLRQSIGHAQITTNMNGAITVISNPLSGVTASLANQNPIPPISHLSMFKPFTPIHKKEPTDIQFAKLTLDDFEFLEILGTGTFGKVRLCRHKESKSYFCIKILNKARIVRLKQTEHTNNEKNVLLSISNPFIVKLYRTFKDQINVYLLMEFVPGGELFNYIRRSGRLPDQVAKIYAAEIVVALEHLHSKNILYRDLKPENLLISELGHIKLTDFGFSKRVNDRTYSMCGTPEYIAPEIILSKGHDKAVDWWSLGILIFEMLTGYPPFSDEANKTIFEKILSEKAEIPEYVHPYAQDLIEKLLVVDHLKRLGCTKDGVQYIKKHPWFTGIDWEALPKCLTPGPLNPGVQKDGDTHNFYKYSDVNIQEEVDENVDYDKLFEEF